MEAVLHEAAREVGGTTRHSEYVSVTDAKGHQDKDSSSVKMSDLYAKNGGADENGFSMRPKADPVDIVFENITYTASMGFRKGRKEILHSINGHLPQGQLIAIMGPSGAGKSTLLNVLSGYSIKGVAGNVYVNGVPRDLKAFRKLSCYITQDDRLQPLLTVEENMNIAADLKLGTEIPRTDKEEIIREILATLGLEKASKTRAARLSGGQKKRLSIALELVNNPLVLFLDEPTTGLDSSSCTQCVKLLKELAHHGRTIICTIHQPSASMFAIFDEVYVLAAGRCLYQGATARLIPFLEDVRLPCPKFHNPADYVIELACEEYGADKIDIMVEATQNGQCLNWFQNPDALAKQMKIKEGVTPPKQDTSNLEATGQLTQLNILLRRDFVRAGRDTTLTWMRIGVNFMVALMLGTLYWKAGADGSKVIDNYNLLFSILMHHMMSTMMLTILTFPSEMSILIKEHFNRWYSLKMYYLSVTLVDIPISIFCCFMFTIVIYLTTAQPLEINRLSMFACISLLTVFVAQSFGLMVGAIFDVVNGTFLGPTLSVPMMMFAGFGVTLRDLPPYLYWGSYISYLRYGLEGVVGAIYGLNRETIDCPEDKYCHYRYPEQFLEEISMRGDQFWNDIIALLIILFFLRIVAYVLLKWKLMSVR